VEFHPAARAEAPTRAAGYRPTTLLRGP
jgi:hypothetical protein